MKVLRETTMWETKTPNHCYIFDDSSSKIVGYIPAGSTEARRFKEPLNFNKRNRTFEPVKIKGLSIDNFTKTIFEL